MAEYILMHKNIPVIKMELTEADGITKILDLYAPEHQYWIKPDGTDLEWKRIHFFDNAFSDDIGNVLFGLKKERRISISVLRIIPLMAA